MESDILLPRVPPDVDREGGESAPPGVPLGRNERQHPLLLMPPLRFGATTLT